VQGLSFPILYLIARVFTRRRLLALAGAFLGIFAAGAFSEIGSVMATRSRRRSCSAGSCSPLRVPATGPRGAQARARAGRAAGVLSGFGSGLKLSAFPFTSPPSSLSW